MLDIQPQRFRFILVPLIFLLLCVRRAENFSSFGLRLGPNVTEYAVGKLPDVRYDLPPSWAGQVYIPGTKKDELFFWLFQAEFESEDLIIWLNGGPGCSSLDGLAKENGPLLFPGNSSTPKKNLYSWTKLANVLYIDQPVGTGFSGGNEPAKNNSDAIQHFYRWLTAFYAKFPGLINKNTYLMGESYAGIYIPYITQAILAHLKTLPINLRSITIGDGLFANAAALTDVSVNAFLHEHKGILNISQEIIEAFDHADRQCGFDDVLRQVQYPPHGKITIPGNPELGNFKRQVNDCSNVAPTTPELIDSSINSPCYGGCATWSTAYAYLKSKIDCFNMYNINYTCGSAPPTERVEAYFNRLSVQKAIHAPNKTFQLCNNSVQNELGTELVQPPAYSVMPTILEQGVPINIYSADYDFLFNHIGTELAIQNMTW
ncbi:hypothetical protein MMC31_006956 [Peltigera leucophlebia]|nr:hypothetical protein [Peltigera leucophlebia]